MTAPFVDLWVPGRPVPKGRPRMTRRGRAYTPQTTHDAEAVILAAYHHKYPAGRYTPSEAPLAAYVDYDQTGQRIQLFELPEEQRSPMRSDVDNLVKLTLDALGQPQGAFLNDRQVVQLVAQKWPNGYDLEHVNLEAKMGPL